MSVQDNYIGQMLTVPKHLGSNAAVEMIEREIAPICLMAPDDMRLCCQVLARKFIQYT